MKYNRKKLLRPEIMVFAIIIVFITVASIIINVPQQQNYQSSLPNLGKAPEFTGISRWINSEPLTIKDLRGKVVLIDFWTYSCINCIRTLPYLEDWYSKYSDKGLVIVGVHTPEFEFEKDYGNVLAAVDKYGVRYPVAQDNSYSTWNAYGNHYWPRHYLIDKDGNIRYDHIGEGNYNETEAAIIELLGLAAGNMSSVPTNTDFSQIGSPEIYLGYGFARENIGNPEGFSPNATVNYSATTANTPNVVYFSGQWKNNMDNMQSVGGSKLYLLYKAKNVNVVAGGSATLKILIDGMPLNESSLGSDDTLQDGSAIAQINGSRLYNIVSAPDYGTHQLELDASPGLQLYTFTFG